MQRNEKLIGPIKQLSAVPSNYISGPDASSRLACGKPGEHWEKSTKSD